MKCWLPLLGALVYGEAAAVQRNASPSGSGTACSSTNPCGLATANSQAQPGDVIRLANGVYSVAPLPASNGTPSAPIEYVGNPLDPTTVKLPGVSAENRRWITWRSLKAISAFDLGSTGGGNEPTGLKLLDCEITTGLRLVGPRFCEVVNCRIVPNGTEQGYFVFPIYSGMKSRWNRFVDNRIELNTGTSENGLKHNFGVLFFIEGADDSVCMRNSLFERNRLKATFNNVRTLNRAARGMYLYGSIGNDWRHNRFEFIDNSTAFTCADRIIFRQRSSTHSDNHYRDTLLVSGRCGQVLLTSQSEDGGKPWGYGWNTRWEECFFKNTARDMGGYAPFDMSYGTRADTLIRNVFITGTASNGTQGGLNIAQFHSTGTTLLDHNTLVSFSSAAPFTLTPATGSFGHWDQGGALKMTSNLLARLGPLGTTSASAFYQLYAGRTATLDYNYYADAAGRSLRYQAGCTGASGAGCTAAAFGAPGSGAFLTATGQEAHGKAGSAWFVNASLASFDASLQALSPARGAGEGGSDAGARPFGIAPPPPPPDTVVVPPPAPVTLTVTPTITCGPVTISYATPGVSSVEVLDHTGAVRATYAVNGNGALSHAATAGSYRVVLTSGTTIRHSYFLVP